MLASTRSPSCNVYMYYSLTMSMIQHKPQTRALHATRPDPWNIYLQCRFRIYYNLRIGRLCTVPSPTQFGAGYRQIQDRCALKMPHPAAPSVDPGLQFKMPSIITQMSMFDRAAEVRASPVYPTRINSLPILDTLPTHSLPLPQNRMLIFSTQ